MLIIPMLEKLRQEDPSEFQDHLGTGGTNFVVLVRVTATSIHCIIHPFIILRAFNI